MTQKIAYAGQHLKKYELQRYSFLERYAYLFDLFTSLLKPRDKSIIVQQDFVDFPDISFYQGTVNFDKMALNTNALIIRAGQNTWEDTKFETNYAQSKSYGISLGAYWFYDGRVSPQSQADKILQVMSGKSLEMEFIVDFEYNYGGAWDNINNVVELIKLIKNKINCKGIMIYTGYYFWLQNTNSSANSYVQSNNIPLWLAWYGSASVVKVPAPWTTWRHWQYGTPPEGTIYGVESVEIDKNKYNGNKASFDKFYGTSTPPPGDTMYYKCVKDVSIRNNTNYPNNTVIGTLKAGDVVSGVMLTNVNPTIPNWVHFDTIWRGGTTKETMDGYSSGNTTYLQLDPTFTPPNPPAGNIIVNATLKTDGTVIGTWTQQ